MRKSYEEKRSRRRARGQQRPWRLKRMAMETEDESTPSAPGRGREQRGGSGGTRHEQDMERFMQANPLLHNRVLSLPHLLGQSHLGRCHEAASLQENSHAVSCEDLCKVLRWVGHSMSDVTLRRIQESRLATSRWSVLGIGVDAGMAASTVAPQASACPCTMHPAKS